MKHRMSVPIKICCFALAFLMIAWTLYVVLDSLVLESVSDEKPIIGPTVSREFRRRNVRRSRLRLQAGEQQRNVETGGQHIQKEQRQQSR